MDSSHAVTAPKWDSKSKATWPIIGNVDRFSLLVQQKPRDKIMLVEKKFFDFLPCTRLKSLPLEESGRLIIQYVN